MNVNPVLNITAQIIGFCGTYMLITLYQQNDHRKLLIKKLFADILWFIHYLLLGAWAGSIPNLVGILRESLFITNCKKTNSFVLPLIFISINWGLAILSRDSSLSALPICASTLVTISLWVKSPALTRILSIPVCITFIIYDIFVGSYAGILNETLSLFSIAVSIFRHKNKYKI